jgi:hypothetical protein
MLRLGVAQGQVAQWATSGSVPQPAEQLPTWQLELELETDFGGKPWSRSLRRVCDLGLIALTPMNSSGVKLRPGCPHGSRGTSFLSI